jgi:hypothetical protein
VLLFEDLSWEDEVNRISYHLAAEGQWIFQR